MPIFVARQWIRHRTANVNEYSGRYSLLPLVFYRPEAEQFQAQTPSNRQGRGGDPLTALHAEAIERWEQARRQSSENYEWLVGNDVARELARIDLPLSVYTQWYWKIDLHNLLHFLRLRVDPHSQYEIRAFARVMAGMLARVAPLSFEAWIDYALAGKPFSRGELAALRKLVQVTDGGLEARPGRLDRAALEGCGLMPREVDELLAKLAPPPPLEDFTLDPASARPAEEFARRMEEAVPRVDRR
jgi:thymidylate synthase (FAD)